MWCGSFVTTAAADFSASHAAPVRKPPRDHGATTTTTGGTPCAGTQLQQYLFNTTYANATGARCLDGSPAGFYYALNSSSSDWVVFIEGGGLCVEFIDCLMRAKTALGTSTVWPQCQNGTNVYDADPRSVGFSTFNRMYVPYCSGDTWSGTATAKNDKLGGLYTSGHLILKAVLDVLLGGGVPGVAGPWMGDGKRMLLSGSSAGGIGTFLSADWVSSYVPSTLDVKAAPQAGWFFPEGIELYYEYALNVSVPLDKFFVDYVASIQHPFLDESCVAAMKAAGNDTSLCWDAPVHYDYITTPLFVANNRFDTNQLFSMLLAPSRKTNGTYPREVERFVEWFGARMNASLTRHIVNGAADNSLFAPSCLDHTGNLCTIAGPVVRHHTLGQALWEWFDGQAPRRVMYVDSCPPGEEGTPCQAVCTCPNGT